MNKHTQGPWQVNKKISTSVEQVSAGQGINLIAQCEDVDGIRSREEDQANARLIAAAPELLDSCEKALISMLKTSLADTTYLIEAIKKAKGE